MTGHTSTESMYAITLHQAWASLIALGIKTVETRSWPAPARLMGQTIAIHAGKRVVKGPGDAIEQELRTRLGEDWSRHIPTGAVLATAVLAGMARVAHITPLTGHAVQILVPKPDAPWAWDGREATPGATSVPAAGCGSSPR